METLSAAAAIREAFAQINNHSKSSWLDERSMGRLAIRAYVCEARDRGAPLHDILIDVIRLSGATNLNGGRNDVIKTFVRWVVRDFFPP